MNETQKRKQDHIDLALKAQTANSSRDQLFHYEPALGHPGKNPLKPLIIAGKKVTAPFWISSMTGGSTETGQINKILASAAKNVGAGMGLGSCRLALEDESSLETFMVRDELGEELPLFANLGIAELEELIENNQLNKLTTLIKNLRADGLIIHLNPLQELLQPEGKCHERDPLQSLNSLLKTFPYPVIVKEVGQGFGPASIEALLKLDIEALELAGFGGTNFSKVENLRSGKSHPSLNAICSLGHDVAEMMVWINQAKDIKCKNIIISGGISHALEGNYYNSVCKLPSLYGIASRLLEPALISTQELTEYLTIELKSYKIAADFLQAKH